MLFIRLLSLIALTLSFPLFGDDDLPDGLTYCGFDEEEMEVIKGVQARSLINQIESAPEAGVLARSILDGGPSAVVAGCVNAITGDFFESEADFIVAGIQPLTVERSYSSATKKWHFRHEPDLVLAPSAGGKHINAVYQDDGGAGLLYRAKIWKEGEFGQIPLSNEAFRKGLTNCSSGEISGKCNWKNSNLRLVKNKFGKFVMLWTGGGVSRTFERHQKNTGSTKGVFFGEFKINAEYRPNGNVIRYNYADQKVAFFTLKQLSEVTLYNSQNEPLSSISRILDKGDTVWKGHWQEVHYLHNSKGRIVTVNCTDRPSVSYVYDDHGRMTHKVLADGRTTKIDYNSKGKVKSLSTSADSDGSIKKLYHFYYDDEQTKVIDAYGNKTLYTFEPESKRLKSISTEAGKLEEFTWTKENGPFVGHLLGRKLKYEGQEVFSQTISYDTFFNITQEVLTGNLTGSGQSEKYIKNYQTSQDGKNQPLEEKDFRKWVRFVHDEKTRNLLKRFTGDGDRIRKREFFAYDKNGAVCREIVDDGIGLDEADLSGVTQRLIKKIRATPTFPVGMPEIVWEYGLNLDTGKEELIKATIYRYSTKGKVFREEHHGSDGVLAYQIHRTFDAFGNTLQETDALGNVTSFTYDALCNKVSEETGNRKKRFAYDKANRLIKEEELGSNGEWLVTHHAYDLLGRRISTVDPVGHEASFEYDSSGRLTKKTLFIDGPCVETYAYDAMGNIIEKVDPEGNVTRTQFTVRGQPCLVVYPDGSREEKEYSLDGLLVRERAKNGLETLYQYDSFGRIISKKVGEKSTSSVYSAFHLLKEIDEEGIETEYRYDSAGRLIEKIKGDHKTSFTYDVLGREHSVTEGDRITIKLHDVKGQVVEERVESTTGALIQKKTSVYDAHGQVIRSSVGDVIAETDYTSEGKPREERDAKGAATKYFYEYSDLYRVTKVDAKGNSEKTSYNGREQPILIEHFSPLGDCVQRERISYNKSGLRVKVEQQRLPEQEWITTAWEYDCMGREAAVIEAQTTPLEQRTETEYTATGQKAKIRKPSGIALQYSYDDYDRLIELTSSDHTVHYQYEYDLKDQVIRAKDLLDDTTTLRQYDVHGRVVSETLANGLQLSYAYNSLDQITHLELPGDSKIIYDYEGGRLKAIHRVKNSTELYAHHYLEYNPAGQCCKEQLIDGQSILSRTYDENGRFKELIAPQYKEKTVYDLVGNPILREINDHETVYTYDALHQLLSETGDAPHHYTYDALYNRTSKDHAAYSVNALNQVTSTEDVEYRYDLDGNLVEKNIAGEKSSYSYDA
ncbi:MAG: DUF6531 domain-containing protein, partial [Parachlamydiaceae bacterium]